MQRVSALWHESPLKIVSALFVLSLVAMMAVASGASFTSTSANPGNIVTAGTMSHSNSKDDDTILAVSGLKPDDSASGTVDIANTGNSDGVFTLTKSNILNSDTDNPLSAKLDLLVEDLGPPSAPTAPVQKYGGKLGAMGTIGLGTYASGEAHRYKFTVTFPDGGTPAGPTSGDNAYKGDSASVRFNWESVTE